MNKQGSAERVSAENLADHLIAEATLTTPSPDRAELLRDAGETIRVLLGSEQDGAARRENSDAEWSAWLRQAGPDTLGPMHLAVSLIERGLPADAAQVLLAAIRAASEVSA